MVLLTDVEYLFMYLLAILYTFFGVMFRSCAHLHEVKCKGEKERYTHLNADFQRIARRDKKAFRSNQCKEIEENNTMGRSLQENESHQGNISCKGGHNKGQKRYGPNRSRRY